MHEVIVIGSGPAGCTAAPYAARAQRAQPAAGTLPEPNTGTSPGCHIGAQCWYASRIWSARYSSDEDGTCLYMDVWEDDAIWLAIIFRGLTPAALDLVFCDEGYTFDVRVVAGCTEGELAELVSAAG